MFKPICAKNNCKSTGTSTQQALTLTVYGCIAACKTEFLHPPAAEQSLHTPVQHRLWLYATSKYPFSLKKKTQKDLSPKP